VKERWNLPNGVI